MLPNDQMFSNGKSSRATIRCTPSPSPHLEQSNILSLNLCDFTTLMKQKEKQYQDELQISNAKRVHNFINDLQERKKQQDLQYEIENRKNIRIEVSNYNLQTLRQFESQWKMKLALTAKQLQQVGSLAQQQHQAECQSVKQKIESIKNGEILQKMKFSRTVLEIQDQLNRLIKAQRYEQAQVVHKRLQKMKKNEMKQFLQQSIDKQKQKLFRLKRKQEKQKQILRDKLSDIYTKQERKHAFQAQKLVKNMRTYEIDMSKIYHSINRKSRQNTSRAQSDKRMRSKNSNTRAVSVLEMRDIKEFPLYDNSQTK